jgi:hypothetical protein
MDIFELIFAVLFYCAYTSVLIQDKSRRKRYSILDCEAGHVSTVRTWKRMPLKVDLDIFLERSSSVIQLINEKIDKSPMNKAIPVHQECQSIRSKRK